MDRTIPSFRMASVEEQKEWSFVSLWTNQIGNALMICFHLFHASFVIAVSPTKHSHILLAAARQCIA
jgi:hypothetical protein